MDTALLVLVVILVVAALVFGVVSLLSGSDPGLRPVEPDGRARPLPNDRSLAESDLKSVRFDVTLRGYRMSQVDRVLRRTAYDVGYKDEMIAVLEAEVAALREGRREDAELLRKAREAAANPKPAAPAPVGRAAPTVAGAPAGDAPQDTDADVSPDREKAEIPAAGEKAEIPAAGEKAEIPAAGEEPAAEGAPVADAVDSAEGEDLGETAERTRG